MNSDSWQKEFTSHFPYLLKPLKLIQILGPGDLCDLLVGKGGKFLLDPVKQGIAEAEYIVWRRHLDIEDLVYEFAAV